MWNLNKEVQEDFLSQVCDEKSGEQLDITNESFEELCFSEDDIETDDEREPEYRDFSSPIAPPYSPLSLPDRHERTPLRSPSPQSDGRRSRSPLRLSKEPEGLLPSGVVLRIFDEDGMPLENTVEPHNMLEIELIDHLNPNGHVLYESAEHLSEGLIDKTGAVGDRNNSAGCARSVRGRVRVGHRGRANRRGRPIRGRRGHTWQPGHPLEEIWITDDDVPLQELARDVVMRRQAKAGINASLSKSNRQSYVKEEEDSESANAGVLKDFTDGCGKTLLEGEDLHFNWSPMDTFHGKEEIFKPKHTGSVVTYRSPYEAFRSYWDDGIMQLIADETNRYASKISSSSFQSEWYPTNSDEILCLFAFWMMTGIIRMPSITSYFAQNSLLKTEIFSRITTLKRYTSLNRSIHFVNTESASDHAYSSKSVAVQSDSVYRLRPIIDHLNSKFQSNYVMSKNICIDESLTLWKGRLKFKQYIRSKAAKFGIKTFELCESASGYLWSFLVYTGNDTYGLDSNMSKSTALVLKLIRPLLNKGHKLFMDNWFNSPTLARFLKRHGTDCVGTLRESRPDVPKLVTLAPLKQGQLVARHSGDVCVISWMDKKRVNMITTCHGTSTALSTVSSQKSARAECFKPQVVLDYNRNMGGVDLKDQMLEPYLLERKRCAKWYLKLFKRLLNVSIHNSRVLLESSLGKRQDNLQFRLELVHSILYNHHSDIAINRKRESFYRKSLDVTRFVPHNHWPVRAEQRAADAATNRHTRIRCVVCLREGRKSQKTTFKCESCNVPLCVENCFKKYHTTV